MATPNLSARAGEPGFRPGLDLLRTVRNQTISMAGRLSQRQVDFAPAGKWSIGEILDHLILSERIYRRQFLDLIALARAGRKPSLHRSTREVNFTFVFLPKSLLPVLEVPFTLMNRFTPVAVREFMIRHKLVPARNPDIAQPQKGRRAEDLRQELAASLEETAALLESNADLDYGSMTVDHAILGSNTVPALLRIVALHEQRHQDQISEIRRSARFPQAA